MVSVPVVKTTGMFFFRAKPPSRKVFFISQILCGFASLRENFKLCGKSHFTSHAKCFCCGNSFAFFAVKSFVNICVYSWFLFLARERSEIRFLRILTLEVKKSVFRQKIKIFASFGSENLEFLSKNAKFRFIWK